MNTEIQRCLDWFDTYTRDYIGRASKDILLTVQSKITHTMRVLAHVRAILRETDIRDDLLPTAELAAILHDVGRFPQLVQSSSFDDRTGYDHAVEGEKILRNSYVSEHLSRGHARTCHDRRPLPQPGGASRHSHQRRAADPDNPARRGQTRRHPQRGQIHHAGLRIRQGAQGRDGLARHQGFGRSCRTGPEAAVDSVHLHPVVQRFRSVPVLLDL